MHIKRCKYDGDVMESYMATRRIDSLIQAYKRSMAIDSCYRHTSFIRPNCLISYLIYERGEKCYKNCLLTYEHTTCYNDNLNIYRILV
jgi:hypothetical protein